MKRSDMLHKITNVLNDLDTLYISNSLKAEALLTEIEKSMPAPLARVLVKESNFEGEILDYVWESEEL